MSRTTIANGNELKLFGWDEDDVARSLAASLDRNQDRLRRVDSGVRCGTADAWFECNEISDTDMAEVPVPDPWVIVRLAHFGDGTVCATYKIQR